MLEPARFGPVCASWVFGAAGGEVEEAAGEQRDLEEGADSAAATAVRPQVVEFPADSEQALSHVHGLT